MTDDEPSDEIQIGTPFTSSEPPKWLSNIQIAPWSVCSCPKNWGSYSESKETGWYVSVAIDDDLAKVDVESIPGPLEAGFRETDDRALRQLLPMLEALDEETLTDKQKATRTRAIGMLRERFETENK